MNEEVDWNAPPTIQWVHTTEEDDVTVLCDGYAPDSGDTFVPVSKVHDHEDSVTFNCGACHKILAGGTEPMGGSLHLSEAHGVGAE